MAPPSLAWQHPPNRQAALLAHDIAAVVAESSTPEVSIFRSWEHGHCRWVERRCRFARASNSQACFAVLLWAGVHLGLNPRHAATGLPRHKVDFGSADSTTGCHVANGHAKPAHGSQCSGRPLSRSGAGEGPSIASPDAALGSSYAEYYSKEISGLSTTQMSNTQVLIGINEEFAPDSAAAIK